VIAAEPVEFAVTTPDGDTVAVEPPELDQVTDLVRSLVVPSEYVPVAV
jgi:hypothetical protein